MEKQSVVQEDEIDLRDYIEVLLKRKNLIISLFILTVGIVFVINLLVPLRFKAMSVVNTIPAHQPLLLSHEVIERIINKLNLKDKKGMVEDPKTLLKKLSIQKTSDKNQVQLVVIDSTVQAVKDIANVWAREYVAFDREMILKESDIQKDFGLEATEIVRNPAYKADDLLNDFRKKIKLDLMNAELVIKKKILNSYKEEITGMGLLMESSEDTLAELKKQIATQEKFIIVSSPVDGDVADPVLSKGLNNFDKKVKVINPAYQNLELRILNAEIDMNIQKLRKEHLIKIIDAMTKDVTELDNEVIKKESLFAQITRDAKLLDETKIIFPAVAPSESEKQNLIKKLVFAGILSLLTGFFIAFFIEYWENGNRTLS